MKQGWETNREINYQLINFRGVTSCIVRTKEKKIYMKVMGVGDVVGRGRKEKKKKKEKERRKWCGKTESQIE